MMRARTQSIPGRWLSATALVVLAGGACALHARPTEPHRTVHAARRPNTKPNVLILLADDMGYGDVGFHGCKDIPTPNLDALAKSGVRCTNGYVSGPYCSPTRAALLTGRYQQRFGHEFNPGGGARMRDIGLPVDQVTIADRLRANGYVTGLVGKWHLGGAPKFHPNRRGFDEFFGFLGGANAYLPGAEGTVPNLLRNQEPVAEKEYLTDALGREAISFIDRHKEKPFFLYLAFNAVHTPMHADDARLKRFASIKDPKRRTYAAMLSALDEQVGNVIGRLRSAGLEENTLIFFFSDNGGPVMQGTSINGSRNDPLRGSKRTTLEGGIHVPFVVSWKGVLPAGKVYDPPVIQIDVLPTVLAAANIQPKPEWKLEGADLVPHLKGEAKAPPHDALYWRFGQMMALRQGDWKLVKYDATPTKLYNLAKDLGESQDLSAANPDRVSAMEETWRKWDTSNVPPLWTDGRVGSEGPRRRARP
jgi:arylsulfatase A-like enzyme